MDTLKLTFLSSYIRSSLKKDQFFSELRSCKNDKMRANELIKEVKNYIKTTVISQKGYSFQNVLYSFGNVVIIEVMGPISCAKVSHVRVIKDEYNIGLTVKGPCVMPIIDFFELEEPGRDSDDKRAAIISPKYNQNLSEWLYENEGQYLFRKEDEIVALMLCGLSAVYSFASKSLCHYDIKLANIMQEGSLKFVLIDFGSTVDYHSTSNSTPGFSFEHSTPSIRYDLNSLAITLAKVYLRDEFCTFFNSNEMFTISMSDTPLFSRCFCF